MIRTFEGTEPDIAESAYIDEEAVVIGNVEIGQDASVWPGAVLRGDAGRIVLGEGANVQDNAVCHADHGKEVVLEKEATMGHCAIVHNATVRSQSVVGMNATVLDDSVIGEYSIVAAGSVVTRDETVPPRALVGGTPAEVLQNDLDESRQIFGTGAGYVKLSNRHANHSESISRVD